jgi:N-acetylglutamate synthase-like GNAT family acetyltransferase
MCSLRKNDGIRPDLEPWLGSLVVDKDYQGLKVGQQLIDTVKSKACNLGYKKLYLFTLDPKIPAYYSKLGWKEIGKDEFKGTPVTVMSIDL